VTGGFLRHFIRSDRLARAQFAPGRSLRRSSFKVAIVHTALGAYRESREPVLWFVRPELRLVCGLEPLWFLESARVVWMNWWR
jgi:hypothetical protein